MLDRLFAVLVRGIVTIVTTRWPQFGPHVVESLCDAVSDLPWHQRRWAKVVLVQAEMN